MIGNETKTVEPYFIMIYYCLQSELDDFILFFFAAFCPFGSYFIRIRIAQLVPNIQTSCLCRARYACLDYEYRTLLIPRGICAIKNRSRRQWTGESELQWQGNFRFPSIYRNFRLAPVISSIYNLLYLPYKLVYFLIKIFYVIVIVRPYYKSLCLFEQNIKLCLLQ